MTRRGKLHPLRYGKKLEERFRLWRRRVRFRLHQRRIARAYRCFETTEVLEHCRRQPLYSIVVPVYRTSLKWLRRCVDSVHGQLYPRWELILVDDGSQTESLTRALGEYAQTDRRIRDFHLSHNQGISAATNHGIAQARGQFVGFLDHDDELTPDALLWMAVAHNRYPNGRWFYSDEATIQPDGNYAGGFHRKPDYSPEFLLSNMFACHFSVYQRELIERVGGLRPEFDGSQDHDLALRVSEHLSPAQVIHIPHVLYFWRALPESTASCATAKPDAALAGRKAVRQALQRRNIPGQVSSHSQLATLYRLELKPRRQPKVSILIPTRNSLGLLGCCVYSLIANTDYPDYEIVVIDNQSNQPELELFLQDLAAQGRIRTFRYDKPFNHSDMHNWAVGRLDSELIVFSNNDVYRFSKRWLEQLVATTQLDPSIAGAGGKLFYPNGTIQHGGIGIGIGGGAVNLWRGAPRHSPGYYGRALVLQEVSAVTGALMILKKSAFERVGGFDSQRYPISFNDVDLWLRLGDAGYRCLYNPEVQAFHHESKTRGVSQQELEYQRRICEDVRRRGAADRFWNLAIFDHPKKRRQEDATAQWALAKLSALRQEAQLLAGSPNGQPEQGTQSPQAPKRNSLRAA